MSGVATAIVGGAVVGGYMSGKATKEAASTAAGAQREAAQLSVAEQRRQFDKMQELLAPYVQAGNTALTSQQALIGLGGPQAQEQAIAGIQSSPLFSALVKQGESALLQQAAATGGLRGGNIQGALAQYRPQMLSQLINQQYERLGGLSSMGQASAAGVGAAGIETGRGVSAAYGAQGDAAAQAALASGRADAQMWNTIGGGIGMAAGYLNQPTAPGLSPGTPGAVSPGNYGIYTSPGYVPPGGHF